MQLAVWLHDTRRARSARREHAECIGVRTMRHSIRFSSRPRPSTRAFAFALLFSISSVSAAQASNTSDPVRSLATRAQLQSDLAACEKSPKVVEVATNCSKEQMDAIRRRLSDGDFKAGDRIVLNVPGEATLTNDTIIVQAGPIASLNGLADVSLKGVLRSELRDYLVVQLRRFLKNPDVHAVSLLSVGVAGDVGRPGYYSMPYQAQLTDVIMAAGGGTGSSDLRRIYIRRGSRTTWPAEETRSAIAKGLTLDQIDLRAGDEIVLGSRRQTNWPLIMGIAGTLLGVATFLTTTRGR